MHYYHFRELVLLFAHLQTRADSTVLHTTQDLIATWCRRWTTPVHARARSRSLRRSLVAFGTHLVMRAAISTSASNETRRASLPALPKRLVRPKWPAASATALNSMQVQQEGSHPCCPLHPSSLPRRACGRRMLLGGGESKAAGRPGGYGVLRVGIVIACGLHLDVLTRL